MQAQTVMIDAAVIMAALKNGGVTTSSDTALNCSKIAELMGRNPEEILGSRPLKERISTALSSIWRSKKGKDMLRRVESDGEPIRYFLGAKEYRKGKPFPRRNGAPRSEPATTTMGGSGSRQITWNEVLSRGLSDEAQERLGLKKGN